MTTKCTTPPADLTFELHIRKKFPGTIYGLDFSDDARLLLVSTQDSDSRHKIVLLDVETDTVVKERELEEELEYATVCFARHDKLVLVGGYSAVAVLDAKSLRVRMRTEIKGYNDAVFFAQGNSLAVCGKLGFMANEVHLYSLSSLTISAKISCREERGNITSLALSPDHRLLATGGMGTVTVYHVASGSVVHRMPGLGSWVRSLSFDPTGEFLACSSGVVKVWDTGDWSVKKTFEERSATGVFFGGTPSVLVVPGLTVPEPNLEGLTLHSAGDLGKCSTVGYTQNPRGGDGGPFVTLSNDRSRLAIANTMSSMSSLLEVFEGPKTSPLRSRLWGCLADLFRRSGRSSA